MSMQETHGTHHIVPPVVYHRVFGALIILTVITVAVAQVDLGALNVPVAVAVATVKAGLVAAYFMGLKYDNKVNLLVFAIGLVMVIVFLGFTLLDSALRGNLTA